MADFQRFDVRKMAADSRNQADLKMRQAEISRVQAEAKRAQVDANIRMGQVRKAQGDQVLAKMKVNQAKNMANRP
jgi:hypothetical protein